MQCTPKEQCAPELCTCGCVVVVVVAAVVVVVVITNSIYISLQLLYFRTTYNEAWFTLLNPSDVKKKGNTTASMGQSTGANSYHLPAFAIDVDFESLQHDLPLLAAY